MKNKSNSSFALVQIDCDREWDNMEVSSKLLWELFGILENNGIKATWFVVGEDLMNPQYNQFFSELILRGHEIGNHSMSHKRNFNLLSYQDKIAEIVQCHRIIEKIGYNPVGFRAPYFLWDASIMKILGDLKYSYDSSVFPCPAYPLINSIKNAMNGKLFADDKVYRNQCFHASSVKCVNNDIVEIPVSVSPVFKLPLHASYSLTLPYEMAQKYTDYQINKYKKNNRPFVYVIHLNDICPKEYFKSCEFKLYIPHQKRVAFLKWVCNKISRSFKTITTNNYVWQNK